MVVQHRVLPRHVFKSLQRLEPAARWHIFDRSGGEGASAALSVSGLGATGPLAARDGDFDISAKWLPGKVVWLLEKPLIFFPTLQEKAEKSSGAVRDEKKGPFKVCWLKKKKTVLNTFNEMSQLLMGGKKSREQCQGSLQETEEDVFESLY